MAGVNNLYLQSRDGLDRMLFSEIFLSIELCISCLDKRTLGHVRITFGK